MRIEIDLVQIVRKGLIVLSTLVLMMIFIIIIIILSRHTAVDYYLMGAKTHAVPTWIYWIYSVLGITVTGLIYMAMNKLTDIVINFIP
jgi:TRAP-type C4-dicarboxylate transport system permease small subunit